MAERGGRSGIPDRPPGLKGGAWFSACPAVGGSLRFPAFHPRRTMAKQKTKKGVVKRMKLTKSGKVKRRHSFTSHLLVRRSTKRKRHLRSPVLCVGKFRKNMAKALGEG